MSDARQPRPDAGPEAMTVDDREVLEEERDHLLASIDDLEAEFAAGDLSEDDYAALKDDYVARAARVLRRLDGTPEPAAPVDWAGDRQSGDEPVAAASTPAVTPAPSRPRSRGPLVLLGIVAFSALAAFGLAAAVGQRGGGTITGNDDTADAKLAACSPLVRQDPPKAISCFDEILAIEPDNVQALSFSARALGSTGKPEEALQRLDRAVELDPTFPNARVFRASIRADVGRYEEALADLGAYYDTKPSPDEMSIVTSTGLNRRIFAGVVPAALQPCWRAAFDGNKDQRFSAATLTALTTCFDGVIAANPNDATALAHRAYARIAQLDLQSEGPEADANESAALADVNAAVRIDPREPDVILLAAFVAAPVQPELAKVGLDRLERDGVRPPLSLIDLDPAELRKVVDQLIAARGSASTTTTVP